MRQLLLNQRIGEAIAGYADQEDAFDRVAVCSSGPEESGRMRATAKRLHHELLSRPLSFPYKLAKPRLQRGAWSSTGIGIVPSIRSR